MSRRLLKLAIVGHTNTGKTSLLRTLTRDAAFGEVSDHPGVTRHVEGTSLLIDGQPAVELYDTPGLEDSIALLELLNDMRGDRRVEGIDLIHRFLDSPAATGRFAQEAKAIRQVLNGDAAIYVIDARDQILNKHRDELEILARCARPVIPLLNFVAGPEARTAEWRDHLSRAAMHAVAEFDTVVFDEDGELRLFEKMRSLLDAHAETLEALIADRRRQRRELVRASASLVADMLIDVAAFVMPVEETNQTSSETAVEALKNAIRARESACVHQLLQLHRFRAEDCAPDSIPVVDGAWGLDLFSPLAMKQFGIAAGRGAAIGALAGLAIDAMTFGASFGAAAATGAAVGAMIETSRSHGKRFIRKARGLTELRADVTTLRLLAAREVELVRALFRRGHASQQPLDLASDSLQSRLTRRLQDVRAPRLAPALERARTRPGWSRIKLPGNVHAAAPTADAFDVDRITALSQLTPLLETAIASAPGSEITI